MGKERKYDEVPKNRMIENLLKIVAMKKTNSQQQAVLALMSPSSLKAMSCHGKQRKKEHLTLHSGASAQTSQYNTDKNGNTQICKNAACRAVLSLEDKFCKRCSCCICHKYDDNKDPSVWMVCSSDSPFENDSCGLSCHMECAFKNKFAGVVKDGAQFRLDGCYCCPSCGRVGDLIGCWKKHITLAKETRRVDTLCYRVFLSRKLLNGTEQFKELHDIVLNAAELLEEEVGPLNGVSTKMARGIVSRLSCGLEVQKLCNLAIIKAESLFSPRNDLLLGEASTVACSLLFEDVTTSSVVVLLKEINPTMTNNVDGYKLWHRKSREESYPEELTCILPKTQKRALVSDLQSCTEYTFKIVAYAGQEDVGQIEGRCFTKSLDTFQKNNELSIISDYSKTSDSADSEECCPSGNKLEIDSQPNEDISDFKVRDLGKIIREAQDHEEGYDCSVDAVDKTQVIQSHDDEKVDEINTNKLISSCEGEPNHDSLPLEASGEEDQIGCNLVQVADLEDTHTESVSALDEERVLAGIGLMKMSQARQRPRKNPTNASIRLVKKGNENYKVTNSKSKFCETGCKLLPSNGVNVALNISHHFNLNKLDSSSGRISRNGYSHANGSDSEVHLHKEDFVAVCENGSSKKRGIDQLEGLPKSDAILQNGGHITSEDKINVFDSNFEFSIKVIRWMECEGYINEEFRKKFLTWFSLRATAEEKKIVYVFIDILSDDPAGLAEQLIDSFSEAISNKKPQILPKGFCTKLWH